MKLKLQKLSLTLLLSVGLFSYKGNAQVANYSFATTTGVSIETGTYTNLLGTFLDDATSAVTPIGFTFTYNSINYTSFSATSNGILQLGASGATAAFTNVISDLSGPYLLAYWDDNYTDSNGFVQYLVTGPVGSRKLVVDYSLSYLGTTGTADKRFQIWLFEGSNTIQFVYGNGNNINQNTQFGTNGFSVGILTNGVTDFQSITTTTNTSSTSVQNDNNNTWPGFGTSYIFNGAAGETNVIASQCGFTMPSNSTVIYANNVPSAEKYRFRVTNTGTSAVVLKEYALRNLFMSSLSNFEYNQTYNVEVAVRKAGVWEPYGSSCAITTANPLTNIITSQCGSTINSRSTNIYANIIYLAQGYRFKVTNLTTSSEQIIDTPIRVFTFNSVFDYQEATTYSVEVAVKNTNGLYLAYGALCTIATPGSNTFAREINTKDDGVYDFTSTAYPNPFIDSFKISFDTNSASAVTITVYDMLGKQLDNRQVDASDVNNIEIGSNLTTGVYNVIVSQDDKTQSLKLIKR